jgi:hypothetical protein
MSVLSYMPTQPSPTSGVQPPEPCLCYVMWSFTSLFALEVSSQICQLAQLLAADFLKAPDLISLCEIAMVTHDSHKPLTASILEARTGLGVIHSSSGLLATV